ncbi:MAG: class I SAM-dependent methyltransferase, partial [Flavobacterium sp.]
MTCLMNDLLLQSDVQEYIRNTKFENKLSFQKSPFAGIQMNELVIQMVSKKKCELKLPTWYGTPNILYPEKISIEQSSSEITAQYKSSIIKGTSLIDITGGFGVDAFYFKKQFEEVFHCEIQGELSEIVRHNFNVLKTNVTCLSGNGLDILQHLNRIFDCIYIDPSRRHQQKGKVFKLEDYQPNVVELLEVYREYSKKILIKVSPLLDIHDAISDLKYIEEIHIVAVNNEVKELLFLLGEKISENPKVITVDFSKNKRVMFEFDYIEIQNNHLSSSTSPLKYLYEPNAAIMKSGGFYALSDKFKVEKLHKNSHLFTSNKFIEFPGRV